MKRRMKTRQQMISLIGVFFMAASNGQIVSAMEAETTVNPDDDMVTDSSDVEAFQALPEVWTETYTYLADTGEPHATVGAIEKEGVLYEPSDVQYQVTPLTQRLSQDSAELWAYTQYEPAQELEENGLHYELTELSTQEWTKQGRFQNVTQYHTYLEGQEVPESLEIKAQDEVTGETIVGTIWRNDLWPDGAAWQEGGLEQWVEYSWNGENWVIEIAGELYDVTEESPWFEECEAKLLQYLTLDPTFYQITSVEWNGDGWEDEEGNWKRSVHITGNRMVPRYQATFSGDLAEADLPMVRYTAHYTSDPQGYLVTATVTYKKIASSLAQEKSSDSSDFESNSDLNETMQPFLTWLSEWDQTLETGKMWGVLLAVLAAVSVGLQTAVIFVLASRKRTSE